MAENGVLWYSARVMASFLKNWKKARRIKENLTARIRNTEKSNRFTPAIQRYKRIGDLNQSVLAALNLSNWPIWAKSQLDPNSSRYLPTGLDRAFNNFQNRNWTVLSLPEVGVSAIVDPNGLVVPHPNSWSIEVALKTAGAFVPGSQMTPITQIFIPNQNAIKTKYTSAPIQIEHTVSLVGADEASSVLNGSVTVKNTGSSTQSVSVWLTINPFNQEGVAPIKTIQYLSEKGFIVDHQVGLLFKRKPDNILCIKGTDQPLDSALNEWQMILSCKCPNGAATGAVEFKLDLEPNQSETLNYDAPAHAPSAMLPILRTAAPKVYQSIIQNKINDYMFDIARFDQTDRLNTLAKLTLPHSSFNRIYSLSSAHLAGFRTDIAPFPSTGVRPILHDIFISATSLCDIGAIHTVREILNTIFNPKPTKQVLFKTWTDLGPISGILLRYLKANRDIEPFQNVNAQLKREAIAVSKRLSHELSDVRFFKAARLNSVAKYAHTPILDLFWAIYGLKCTAQIAQELYDFESANQFLTDATHYQSRLIKNIEVLFARERKSEWLPSDSHILLDERICGLMSVVTDMGLLPPNHPLVVGLINQIKAHYWQDGMVYTHEFMPGLSPVFTAQFAQIVLAQGDIELAWEIWDSLISTASATATWPERIHPQTRLGTYGEGHDLSANAAFIQLSHLLILTPVETGIEISVPELAWATTGATLSIQNLGCKWGTVSIEIKLNLDDLDIQIQPNLNAEAKDIFLNLPKNIGHFPPINGVHRLSNRRLKFTRNAHQVRIPFETAPVASFGLVR